MQAERHLGQNSQPRTACKGPREGLAIPSHPHATGQRSCFARFLFGLRDSAAASGPRSVAGQRAMRKRRSHAHDLDYFKSLSGPVVRPLLGYPSWDRRLNRVRAPHAVRASPFAAVLVVSILFASVEYPNWLLWWLWGTYLVCAYGILRAWWLPYLGTPDPDRAKRYGARFARTHGFLPERNGIRPDTLHVAFHVLVVAILVVLAFTLHAPMNIMMSCASKVNSRVVQLSARSTSERLDRLQGATALPNLPRGVRRSNCTGKDSLRAASTDRSANLDRHTPSVHPEFEAGRSN
jgi:hypothetical protein